jgi:hypothetical protein
MTVIAAKTQRFVTDRASVTDADALEELWDDLAAAVRRSAWQRDAACIDTDPALFL